jgi:hypothetical protein
MSSKTTTTCTTTGEHQQRFNEQKEHHMQHTTKHHRRGTSRAGTASCGKRSPQRRPRAGEGESCGSEAMSRGAGKKKMKCRCRVAVGTCSREPALIVSDVATVDCSARPLPCNCPRPQVEWIVQVFWALYCTGPKRFLGLVTLFEAR